MLGVTPSFNWRSVSASVWGTSEEKNATERNCRRGKKVVTWFSRSVTDQICRLDSILNVFVNEVQSVSSDLVPLAVIDLSLLGSNWKIQASSYTSSLFTRRDTYRNNSVSWTLIPRPHMHLMAACLLLEPWSIRWTRKKFLPRYDIVTKR